MFGWSHQKDSQIAPIAAMTVRFERAKGQEPYLDRAPGYGFDWRYTATVSLTVKDRSGVYSAPTSCDWSQGSVSAWLPELNCWIDCDGGSIDFLRVPGQNAVYASWQADTHLRMSSCGGGGAILRAGNKSKTFRLTSIPNSACAALTKRGELPPR